MHAVIYTKELEPITVVWLASWAVKMLRDHSHVAFAVCPPMSAGLSDFNDFSTMKSWVVRLRGDEIRMNRASTWILTTDDEEVALLLKAAFLPGQQQALRERDRVAMAKGAMSAFDLIRRLGDEDFGDDH